MKQGCIYLPNQEFTLNKTSQQQEKKNPFAFKQEPVKQTVQPTQSSQSTFSNFTPPKNNIHPIQPPVEVETKSDEKFVVWHIQGGLGKNIAATALTRDIKAKYSDRTFIIVCSWPEVFLNNPHVDRVYQLGQSPYFYEDYILDKDVLVFRQEPYFQTGHITKKNHIIQSWCELLGIEYTNQRPVIFPNYIHKKIHFKWNREKPTLILHTNGGPMDSQDYSYSWTRDMPIEVAEEIVSLFKPDYHIFQITRPDGYTLDGVERIDQRLSNMELISILVNSRKRVLIDSSLQHAAAALDLKSTVLWIGTSAVNFGYDLHSNIQARLPKKANQLIGSYLFDFEFQKNIHECPYMEITDMFDMNTILNSVKNT